MFDDSGLSQDFDPSPNVLLQKSVGHAHAPHGSEIWIRSMTMEVGGIQTFLSLPPSSGMDDPGWVLPVVIVGATLASILIVVVMFRRR